MIVSSAQSRVRCDSVSFDYMNSDLLYKPSADEAQRWMMYEDEKNEPAEDLIEVVEVLLMSGPDMVEVTEWGC